MDTVLILGGLLGIIIGVVTLINATTKHRKKKSSLTLIAFSAVALLTGSGLLPENEQLMPTTSQTSTLNRQDTSDEPTNQTGTTASEEVNKLSQSTKDSRHLQKLN